MFDESKGLDGNDPRARTGGVRTSWEEGTEDGTGTPTHLGWDTRYLLYAGFGSVTLVVEGSDTTTEPLPRRTESFTGRPTTSGRENS